MPRNPADATSTAIEDIRSRSPHGPQTVDTALLAIAMTGGGILAAQKLLKPKGIDIPRSTLETWPHIYPNRYRDIAERHKSAIEGEIVASVRSLALRASHVAQRALELEEQRIESGEIHDAAASLRNIATTVGIAVDKTLLIEGRPTQITEQRTTDDVLAGLRDKGYIDSTAVETTEGPAGAEPSVCGGSEAAGGL